MCVAYVCECVFAKMCDVYLLLSAHKNAYVGSSFTGCLFTMLPTHQPSDLSVFFTSSILLQFHLFVWYLLLECFSYFVHVRISAYVCVFLYNLFELFSRCQKLEQSKHCCYGFWVLSHSSRTGIYWTGFLFFFSVVRDIPNVCLKFFNTLFLVQLNQGVIFYNYDVQ